MEAYHSPPDPRRPPIPYLNGFSFTIRSHQPVPPFVPGHETAHPLGPKIHWDFGGRDYVMPGRKTQSEWCTKNPLIDSVPTKNQTVHSLHVIDSIAGLQGRT